VRRPVAGQRGVEEERGGDPGAQLQEEERLQPLGAAHQPGWQRVEEHRARVARLVADHDCSVALLGGEPVLRQARDQVQQQRLAEAADQLAGEQQRVGAVRRGAERGADPLEQRHYRLRRRAGHQRGAQAVPLSHVQREKRARHVGEEERLRDKGNCRLANQEALPGHVQQRSERVPGAGAEEVGEHVRKKQSMPPRPRFTLHFSSWASGSLARLLVRRRRCRHERRGAERGEAWRQKRQFATDVAEDWQERRAVSASRCTSAARIAERGRRRTCWFTTFMSLRRRAGVFIFCILSVGFSEGVDPQGRSLPQSTAIHDQTALALTHSRVVREERIATRGMCRRVTAPG